MGTLKPAKANEGSVSEDRKTDKTARLGGHPFKPSQYFRSRGQRISEFSASQEYIDPISKDLKFS